jgi:peptide/nickel transport system ATP-binding protein
MPELLEVEGLTVDYPTRKGVFTAIENVSFHVSVGEILGIVGESGAGKSTIGAAVMRLIDYPGYIREGQVRLKGNDLAALSDRDMTNVRGSRIGMIFQDPLTALNPVLTVGTQIRETLKKHTNLDATAINARAIELLTQVGIPEPGHRLAQYPHQFSGGMRQRVVIAIALAGEPELLIADEPTTALDVSIQSEILALIQGLCRDRNLGVILITHDMAVINEVSDRVIVMLHGHIVEVDDTRKIIESPSHPYTQSLIAAVPRTDVKLERFQLVEATAGGESAIEAMSKDVAWLCGAATEPQTSGPMIKVDNLTVRFLKTRGVLTRWNEYFVAVDDVSFQIMPGETFGLVGESGSGKSTVAKTIVGLEEAYGGRIQYKRQDITNLSRDAKLRRHATDMQIIFQDPFSSLNPRMRVRDIVMEPMVYHNLAEAKEARSVAEELLERVGLAPGAGEKYPHQFSGGQRQRICIARALVMRPRMLICDEPTSALDVSIQASLLNLLKDLQSELGLTMLFISHDLAVIRQMCDRIAVMRYSKLCEVAEGETLFAAPQHAYTKELLRLAPKFSGEVAV